MPLYQAIQNEARHRRRIAGDALAIGAAWWRVLPNTGFQAMLAVSCTVVDNARGCSTGTMIGCLYPSRPHAIPVANASDPMMALLPSSGRKPKAAGNSEKPSRSEIQ